MAWTNIADMLQKSKWAVLKKSQKEVSCVHSWESFKVPEPECTPSPHLKVNVLVARSNSKIKHQAILLHAFTPWYFQVQDKAQARTKRCFYVAL